MVGLSLVILSYREKVSDPGDDHREKVSDLRDDHREFIFPNEGDNHRCADDEEEILFSMVMKRNDDKVITV